MKKREYVSRPELFCCVALLAAWACAGTAQAASYTAKGSYTGDWADPNTWTNNNGAWPNNGDDVQITNASSVVILSSPSSNLNSLVVSKTLTFTNWTSSLTASNVTILTNGTVNLPAAFSNNLTSNRVWIVCTNLFVASGGMITADNGGYAGGSIFGNLASGPGGGLSPASADYCSGAGYGGHGGFSYTGTKCAGGIVYGVASAPEQPGSGGGGNPYTGSDRGGAGGGAVRIQASGQVTVNGTVTANGETRAAGTIGGGGSGGGIWIDCNTFVGTNGLIQANGGSARATNGGGGGGGRIAINYNPAAQAGVLPKPSVRCLAKPGAGYAESAFGIVGTPPGADIGTLWTTDWTFLDPTNVRHVVQWMPASGNSAAFDSLVVTDAWVRLSIDGLNLTVTNDLKVTGGPLMSTALFEIGMPVANGSSPGSNYNYYLRYGYACFTSGPSINVGGNLILTNNGTLYLGYGSTNFGGQTFGARIGVTNTISIASGSWLYPYCHPTNGVAPLIVTRDLQVLAGGGINAVGRGFASGGGGGGDPVVNGYGPGGGGGYLGAHYTAGGGHGGKGGNASSGAAGGTTYGSSNAPALPGGGAGRSQLNTSSLPPGVWGGPGGGVIHIQASGQVNVNGSLNASGANGQASTSYGGGGAGGSVWLDCQSISGAGSICATGGVATTLSVYGGGGGGGRIAIWRWPRRDSFTGSGTFSVLSGLGGTTSPGPGTLYVVDHPDIPTIANQSPSLIGATNAWLVGNLLTTGASPTEVYGYWGTNDGLMVKENWGGTNYLGTNAPGLLTNMVYNLTQSTKYYYRFYAKNSAGDDWGPSSSNFTTLGVMTVDNDGGASGQTPSSATLTGQINGGNPTPDTFVCWGSSDVVADSTSAWEHVEYTGKQGGLFSTNITGLLANKTYYYRCFATNIYGGAWALTSTNFATTAPALAIGDAQVAKPALGFTTNAFFAVTLSAESAVDVTVDFNAANGTASAGTDYYATNGMLTIPSGAVSGSIAVVVIGDNSDHWPSQDFFVNLSGPANAVLAKSQGYGVMLVTNDTAETKTWTGTGNWNSGANWSPATGLPSPSDAVIIPSGAVTLSNAVTLASLVVSNGATLTFTNWMTSLTASNVTIQNGGVVNLPGAFSNNVMSNRVWIVCTNLFVALGGTITADNGGYAGGDTYSAYASGPGAGLSPAGADFCSGAGYGGHGGFSYTGTKCAGGIVYGVASAPEQPGSGGGGNLYTAGDRGGAGGGVIRIQASGQVMVNGTVTANGQKPAGGNYGGGGSGGGIWIDCNTFVGTNGLIQADGGSARTSNGGAGGGGRIAVNYNAGAQAGVLPKPSVRFLANAGAGYAEASGFGLFTPSGGDMGTLWFPDWSLLDPANVRHVGQWIPGNQSSLAVDSMLVTDAWVRLAIDGLNLTVSNDLKVVGGATMSSSVLEIGSVVTNGTSPGSNYNYYLRYAYFCFTSGPSVSVGGNLVLTNGGNLFLGYGNSNLSGKDYGSILSVGGTLKIAASSSLALYSNPTNGVAPLVQVQDLNVATGGLVDGAGKGYASGGGGGGDPVVNGYGLGGGQGVVGAHFTAGGGYGGGGGGSSAPRSGGGTYGSSNAPALPGGGAGRSTGNSSTGLPPGEWGGLGGGLLRIQASGQVTVNGTISANASVSGRPSSIYGGGGAGGGIRIDCKGLAGAGTICANGGNAMSYATGSSGGGGGGGGRIAIKRYPSRDTFSGTYSAMYGNGYQNGSTGTVVLLDMPYQGTIITVH